MSNKSCSDKDATTDLLESGLDEGGVVCDGARRDGDVREHLDLEVGREGVRQPHVPRERREDQVAHLKMNCKEL